MRRAATVKYREFLRVVAHRLQCDDKYVKYVLHAAADVLGTMEEGEVTRTPFGGFHMCLKKKRPILLPDGKTTAEVSEQLVARLVPGKRLRKQKKAPLVWLPAEAASQEYPEPPLPESEPTSLK